ncbi:MAG: hypothetical protein Ct9H300mP28_37480 [Pseudomonadota bacterium]|nr:MAG: hypothetical protein Ct9H300mP28_37480 [Pseudomonadota bacterium]
MTADFLKKNWGRQLINIHGQHDNQSLFETSSHLDFLDGFGKLLPLRKKVGHAYRSLQEARKKFIKLEKNFLNVSFALKNLNL